MKKSHLIIIYVCAMLSSLGLKAQETVEGIGRLGQGLTWRAEVQATVSDGQTPLWLNANKYGLSSLDDVNGYLRGGIFRPLAVDSMRRWGIGYGVDAAVATGFTSTLVVQQAYAELRWMKGVLTVGSKEQPLELKNQQLSSGSQTLGINARPVPSVRIALPNYWDIPGTRGLIALKGHIAYGKRTDDAWQKDFTHQQSRYTEGSFIHTKAGYLRVGSNTLNVELGVEAGCEFGGKAYNVSGVEPDGTVENAQNLSAFFHALVPGGSDATDGSFQNKEGNHMGSWLARLNIDQPTWALGVYADHYFEDNSSMLHLSHNGWGKGAEAQTKVEDRYFFYDMKDWMLGAELKLKECSWLNEVVVEYLYTKYQGGPVYHDHTPNVSEHLCGRDNFYNHYIFTGWQHWGQVMGNPLYLSPIYNQDGLVEVENNRFTAWHLGLGGQPFDKLSYRVLATLQKNLGTYYNLVDDPKDEVSLLAEACYRFGDANKTSHWYAKAAFGLDNGGLRGDNVGLQLTIGRTGLFGK
ncbi:MAG: capsule assembly Wzi family protein [Prevotella sp.]|nr:capsule assembly Wzi family protein [Prevotella sp.]